MVVLHLFNKFGEVIAEHIDHHYDFNPSLSSIPNWPKEWTMHDGAIVRDSNNRWYTVIKIKYGSSKLVCLTRFSRDLVFGVFDLSSEEEMIFRMKWFGDSNL